MGAKGSAAGQTKAAKMKAAQSGGKGKKKVSNATAGRRRLLGLEAAARRSAALARIAADERH